MFRLKELRQQKGISQLKLSMDLHMGQNTISRYENEVREADYKTLILIADYFETSIDYLLGRTNNPLDYPANTNRKNNTVQGLRLNTINHLTIGDPIPEYNPFAQKPLKAAESLEKYPDMKE